MPMLLRFGPSGGTGGAPFDDMRDLFEDDPPADLRIVRLNIRAGARIDAIEVSWSNGQFARHGGDGGDFHDGGGLELTRIQGHYGTRVDSLLIPTIGDSPGEFFGGGGGDGEFRYEVPPGFRLIGFFGRAGSELDALGTIVLRQP